MITKNRCKIVGLRVGEIDLGLLSNQTTMLVRYALIGDEGRNEGIVSKSSGWSEETLQALRLFVVSVEKDKAIEIFEMPEELDPIEQVQLELFPDSRADTPYQVEKF